MSWEKFVSKAPNPVKACGGGCGGWPCEAQDPICKVCRRLKTPKRPQDYLRPGLIPARERAKQRTPFVFCGVDDDYHIHELGQKNWFATRRAHLTGVKPTIQEHLRWSVDVPEYDISGRPVQDFSVWNTEYRNQYKTFNLDSTCQCGCNQDGSHAACEEGEAIAADDDHSEHVFEQDSLDVPPTEDSIEPARPETPVGRARLKGHRQAQATQPARAHEGSRSTHEASRSTHEAARSTHEAARSTHEAARSTHEGSRSLHEGSRVLQESTKTNNSVRARRGVAFEPPASSRRGLLKGSGKPAGSSGLQKAEPREVVALPTPHSPIHCPNCDCSIPTAAVPSPNTRPAVKRRPSSAPRQRPTPKLAGGSLTSRRPDTSSSMVPLPLQRTSLEGNVYSTPGAEPIKRDRFR